MSVPSCAPAMDITEAACVTARRAGRGLSATSRSANAKCPAAMDMDAVLRAIVTANVAGKDNSANYVSIREDGILRRDFFKRRRGDFGWPWSLSLTKVLWSVEQRNVSPS